MKKLLVIAIAAFAFTACNNAAKTEESKTDSPAATTETPAATPVDTAAAATTVDTAAATTAPATH